MHSGALNRRFSCAVIPTVDERDAVDGAQRALWLRSLEQIAALDRPPNDQVGRIISVYFPTGRKVSG